MPTSTCLLALLALTGPGDQAESDQGILIEHCIVAAIDEVELPAQREGLLVRIAAKEGEPVAEDAVLAEIDDRDAQLAADIAGLEHQAAAEESDNDIRIRAAEAGELVAEAEFIRAEELFGKTPPAVSEAELARRRLAHRQSELQIDLAKHEYKIAGITTQLQAKRVDVAELDLAKSEIKAPWSGVLLARLRREGEWVQRGQPVVRLLRLDRLRVEGYVKLADSRPADLLGAEADVVVGIGRQEQAERTGRVNYVSPQVEGGQCRVWVEIDNLTIETDSGPPQWLIRPGMFAAMAIQPRSTAVPTASEN